MRLMGFNFNKISAERFSDTAQQIKINTNIDVSEIKDVKGDFFKMKETILGVNFSYIVDYTPNFAKIELKGNLLIAVETKLAKDILKQWKDKKMPEDFRIFLFNIILKKSNLKALQLEEEINLPFHIPLPNIRKSEDSPPNNKNPES